MVVANGVRDNVPKDGSFCKFESQPDDSWVVLVAAPETLGYAKVRVMGSVGTGSPDTAVWKKFSPVQAKLNDGQAVCVWINMSISSLRFWPVAT